MEGKLFGIPINSGSLGQINKRKDLLAKPDKSAEEMMLISNKGAWIRMASGINVVPKEYMSDYLYLSTKEPKEREKVIADLKTVGNDAAIGNILMGGTMYGKKQRTANAAAAAAGGRTSKNQLAYRAGLITNDTSLSTAKGSYDQTPEYGFRPMPGITDFKIQSKSAYGALKEIQLSIRVNSREQLNTIDMLYLRPGYDMLVEWGNAVYLDKDASANVHVNRQVLDQFLKAKSPKQIQAQIEYYKQNTDYNYDAIIGKVINFDWSYNIDGSYDCSVKLITKGELMESLSSHKHATKKNPLKKISKNNTGEGSSDIDDSDTISLLINSLRFIETKAVKDVKELLPEQERDKVMVFKSGLEGETYVNDEGEEEQSKNYHWFMPLGSFLTCLNHLFIDQDSDGEPALKFATDQTYADMVTHKLLVSSDPGVCGVPYKSNPAQSKLHRNGERFQTVRDMYGDIEPAIFKTAYNTMKNRFKDEFNRNSPLNILLNLDYVLQVQKAFLSEKKKNLNKEQVVYSFVKKLLDGISTSLGGVNILDLQQDSELNEWIIVDRNTFGPSLDKQPLPRIDIAGLKSFVTNFSLQSKISNAIANSLAIGASASGLNQRNNETLLEYNQQLINRYDFAPPYGTTMTPDQETEELFDIIRKISNAYKTYLATKTYSQEEFQSLAIDYANFSRTYAAKERRYDRIDNKPTFFPGMLPIDLSITMDGISGLKVGEAFTISPSVLPERYLDKVAFVITQIEHSIDADNRWETDLTCKMFNLPATAIATEREARESAEIKARPIKMKKKDTGKDGWLTPSSHPWSAAFISFVSKKGYSSFPGNIGHTGYAQALRSDSNWDILEARKTKPKVGDIILYPRAGNNVSFTDAIYKGSSHSDIVVAVNGRKYTIIGGNVGNTVKKQQKTANTSGYESPWTIVMRPKPTAVNIQAIVNACESEWRFWHRTEKDRENQYADKESAANKETARGDALLSRLDNYWAAASKSWGGQITRET